MTLVETDQLIKQVKEAATNAETLVEAASLDYALQGLRHYRKLLLEKEDNVGR